ncbi:MFS transporter [Microbacterium sp. MPKO10]|uniref:MFS transporter n=1 Tax=Microbacterium sp. MPKO10 TaxID=2989818 RepID=UPI002235870B|nr:MFS transporter [Microbacterium sp. MPKO10]MCW4458490.1 MFS transporter [Microbacterium sp. MPKO10]
MTRPVASSQTGRRSGLLVTVLSLASAVAALQQAVVIPILPRLVIAFDSTLTSVSWALTVSLLVGAIATPIAGRLGDIVGHKPVLLVVIALLTAGSIVGALSSSLPVFIVARVLQGFAAAVIPLAIGLLRDHLPAHRARSGIGIVSATLGAGNGVGMLLAGIISALIPGYVPLFWIITGLSGVALVLSLACIPSTRVRRSGRLDIPGALLLSGTLVTLLLAISQGPDWGWGSAATLSMFVASAVLGTFWVLIERRVTDPIVDISMLIDPRTISATLASLFLGFGLFGAFVLIPALVQTPVSAGYGFGATVLGAAIFLMPTTILMLAISLVSGRLTQRFSASAAVGMGGFFTAGALVFVAVFHENPASIYVGTTILGIGIGLAFAALGIMAVEHVRPEQTASASGINSLARLVGGSIASPTISAVLVATIPPGSSTPTSDGYVAGFLIAAIGAAVAAVIATIAARSRHRAARQPENANA